MNKINKILTLMDSFIKNESVYSVALRSTLSYVSVSKYYKEFRSLSATICEKEYELLRRSNPQYEEYFYLENSKRKKKEAIFDAHNFLTFDYDNHIYTIIMPSLKQYKNEFIQDGVDGHYVEEFNKFKRDNKIIKISQRHNNIVKFWEYFERSILIYKGISSDSFAYYLKEYEFKYNHSKNEAIKLLIKNYFKEER